MRKEATHSIQSLTTTKMEDHVLKRGKEVYSMVHAAVCQAVLAGRPEYLQELATPNPPVLV